MLDVVKDAVLRQSLNTLTGKHEMLWSNEGDLQENVERGNGSIRGGGRGKRQYHGNKPQKAKDSRPLYSEALNGTDPIPSV